MVNSRKAQKHKRNHLERQKVRSGRAATIAARHTARRRSARQKRISAQAARSKVRFQSPRPNRHFLPGWIYPHRTGSPTVGVASGKQKV